METPNSCTGFTDSRTSIHWHCGLSTLIVSTFFSHNHRHFSAITTTVANDYLYHPNTSHLKMKSFSWLISPYLFFFQFYFIEGKCAYLDSVSPLLFISPSFHLLSPLVSPCYEFKWPTFNSYINNAVAFDEINPHGNSFSPHQPPHLGYHCKCLNATFHLTLDCQAPSLFPTTVLLWHSHRILGL